jgi:xylan 1,4-beta-xylosidase
LRTIDSGFGIIGSFPELKGKPVVLGESDPDGCAACQGPQLGYRNGTMYSSYTATVFAREHELAERHGVNLEGAVTWAFEFEGQPYFAGFRVLATNGIDLPVLNVFRMFAKMNGQRLTAESDGAVSLDDMIKSGVRGRPDVSALASLDAGAKRLCAMVWHYHDDDVPGPAAAVNVSFAGLPEGVREARVQHFRIDERHSNAYSAWRAIGSPQQPTAEQYAQLERAGHLETLGPAETVRVDGGRASLRFELPRQGVSLVVLEWD